ncbi:YbdK family carboxylate-amine ligase [Kitasatospora sp. NPDC096147]|uniref:carboxylate-amine ligase n=1 Tax=Kitasatospora sp. NPDC096147 TaxID=3364093 RepID=UPI0037FA0DEB
MHGTSASRVTRTRGGLRFGVEEEFLLVDPVSRRTVPAAPEVLPSAARRLGSRAQAEFLATQVEACTRPVLTAGDLSAELAATRAALTAAAGAAGCRLAALPLPVLPSHHPLPVTEAPRYRQLAAHVGGVADQVGGELCGCHVHIGDLTRAEALAVSAAARPWLPVLQALSVNSPYCEGDDVGAASTRDLRYAAWPTHGPAPVLDEEGYERTARRLVEDRVVLDRKMIYWYARPSEHLPTLEFRFADTNPDTGAVLLLACLLRALVYVLLGDDGPSAAGSATWQPSPADLRAAHREVALHGPAARCPHPFDGTPRPVTELLEDLLVFAGPGLRFHGDHALAHGLLRRLRTDGTGASRQRAVYARRGSLADVVDEVVAATAAGARGVPAPVRSG